MADEEAHRRDPQTLEYHEPAQRTVTTDQGLDRLQAAGWRLCVLQCDDDDPTRQVPLPPRARELAAYLRRQQG